MCIIFSTTRGIFEQYLENKEEIFTQLNLLNEKMLFNSKNLDDLLFYLMQPEINSFKIALFKFNNIKTAIKAKNFLKEKNFNRPIYFLSKNIWGYK